MTVTPTARRVRRAPRATAAVVAILAAVTALALPTTGATAAPAPAPSPSVSPTQNVEPGTTVFTLAPVANGVVRPGDPLAVSLTMQNGTDAATGPLSVSLRLGRTALPDRDALRDWLSGISEGVAVEPIASATIESVAPGGENVTGIQLAPDDPALAGLAAGVYPLIASYETEAGIVTSTSAIIVPPGEQSVSPVAVLVPITAAPRSEGLLTADELIELTGPTGALTSQLDGVAGTEAILAVDPAIPAAIRVLGSFAPATATAWLERLDALPNTRFALQFGDADVSTEIEAGLPRPVGPTSLAAYMDPAAFLSDPEATPGPGDSPTPTPAITPPADPLDPVFPSLETLLSVGDGARPGVYWPADGSATAATIEALGGIPADEQPTLTVVPSASTAAGAEGRTVTAHATVGGAEALVFDSDVSRALRQGSTIEKSSLRAAPLTAATAYLAFATAEAGGAPVLVTVGRDADRSRIGLRTAVTTAAEAPQAAAVPLNVLTAVPAVEAEITAAAVAPERVAAASALFAQETELSRFATILDTPSVLTGPERAEILQLLAVSWITHEGWAAAVADHREQTVATLGAVELLPTSTIDLYGSSAGLRFWVRNDLPYPVNLVLYATPDNLRLDVQRENPVVATASSNTRVEVPVQARVGNGDVTLALQLRSPSFVAIGEPQSVDVTVRAEWEGFGIAALGVVVGGLLLFGIVRTVLRVRARRKGSEAA
jgi:hypothetical protein